MRDAGSPAAIGRSHALQRLADVAERIAAEQESTRQAAADRLAAEDEAYLRAVAETCRSIANRLRNSPGFQP